MSRIQEKPRRQGGQRLARAVNGSNEGAIWVRLIGSDKPTFSAALARSILDLEFPPEDRARMHELAAKARAGSLAPAEQVQIDSYSRVGSILGLMKSKARVSLKKLAKSNATKR
jgi:hypothetical protein